LPFAYLPPLAHFSVILREVAGSTSPGADVARQRGSCDFAQDDTSLALFAAAAIWTAAGTR